MVASIVTCIHHLISSGRRTERDRRKDNSHLPPTFSRATARHWGYSSVLGGGSVFSDITRGEWEPLGREQGRISIACLTDAGAHPLLAAGAHTFISSPCAFTHMQCMQIDVFLQRLCRIHVYHVMCPWLGSRGSGAGESDGCHVITQDKGWAPVEA